MRGLLYLFVVWLATGFTSCSGDDKRPGGALHAQVDTLLRNGAQYEDGKDVKQALLCYWDALDLLENQPDSVLKIQAFHRLGDLLFRYGVYEKAVEHHREGYNLALRLSDDGLLYEAARKLARDYALLHQADTADYFFRKSRHIARQHGWDDEAASGEEHLSVGADAQYADSIGTLYDRERILTWEARYKQQKAQLAAERRQAEAAGRLAVFLVVLLLLSAGWFMAYRHKQKEAERRERQLRWFHRLLEDTRTELACHQSELFVSRQRIRELQQALADKSASLQENKRLREELEYYMKQETEMFAQEKALREREKALLSEDSLQAVALLNRMKNAPVYRPVRSEDEWRMLAAFAELLYPGCLPETGTDSGLTERERKLCILIRLGFSTGQLAVFEGISPGSVTKAKFRIQKKLEAAKQADVRMA